jgi:hypothetical protein
MTYWLNARFVVLLQLFCRQNILFLLLKKDTTVHPGHQAMSKFLTNNLLMKKWTAWSSGIVVSAYRRGDRSFGSFDRIPPWNRVVNVFI